MEKEVWKDIAGYEGLYQVSNFGRVRNNKKVIKPQQQNSGYLIVALYKNGQRRAYTVHRLVAGAFLEKCDEKTQVNHKNGNKRDNRHRNLEWCTSKENILHRIYTLRKWNSPSEQTKRKILCVETGVIYNSIVEAADSIGAKHSNLVATCRGYPNRHTVKGYHWEYVD